MNEHQRKAHEAPVGGEAISPGDARYYRHDEHHGGVRVTVMVTVDAPGAEPSGIFGHDAVWHVSVSCWPRPGAPCPLPVARWKRRHREAALRAQAMNAGGVGDQNAQAHLVEGGYSVHLYVPLSGEELAGSPGLTTRLSR